LVIADRTPVPALIETFWQHVERSIPKLSHILGAAQSKAAIAP
jgi:hypothetical protein